MRGSMQTGLLTFALLLCGGVAIAAPSQHTCSTMGGIKAGIVLRHAAYVHVKEETQLPYWIKSHLKRAAWSRPECMEIDITTTLTIYTWYKT